MAVDDNNDGVRRVTVSMPEETFQALDRLVGERGFDSRSQAVAEWFTSTRPNTSGKWAPRSWPAR
jgi:hypothetical protein